MPPRSDYSDPDGVQDGFLSGGGIMSQQIEGRVLSPQQKKIGQSFNQLRDAAVAVQGKNEDLIATMQDLRSAFEADLKDADDTIAKRDNEITMLKQLLAERDRKIVELDEMLQRERAKRVRASTTFDGIKQHIAMMEGEMHVDDLTVGRIPNKRLAPEVEEQLDKDFEEIGRVLQQRRALHPALNDEPRPSMMQSVVDDIANSSEAQPQLAEEKR